VDAVWGFRGGSSSTRQPGREVSERQRSWELGAGSWELGHRILHGSGVGISVETSRNRRRTSQQWCRVRNAGGFCFSFPTRVNHLFGIRGSLLQMTAHGSKSRHGSCRTFAPCRCGLDHLTKTDPQPTHHLAGGSHRAVHGNGAHDDLTDSRGPQPRIAVRKQGLSEASDTLAVAIAVPNLERHRRGSLGCRSRLCCGAR